MISLNFNFNLNPREKNIKGKKEMRYLGLNKTPHLAH